MPLVPASYEPGFRDLSPVERSTALRIALALWMLWHRYAAARDISHSSQPMHAQLRGYAESTAIDVPNGFCAIAADVDLRSLRAACLQLYKGSVESAAQVQAHHARELFHDRQGKCKSMRLTHSIDANTAAL